MKKNVVASILLTLAVFIPSEYAFAVTFSCTQSLIEATKATLVVQPDSGTMQPYNTKLQLAQSSGSPLIPPVALTSGTSNATYGFTDLQPSTEYRAFIVDSSNVIVQEIKGCGFTTKTITTTTSGGSGGSATAGSFRINANAQTTLATIVTTSRVLVSTKGTIFIMKGDTDITVDYCDNYTFLSGIPSDVCTAENLSPGTLYTVRISAKDVNGNEYIGNTQFTTKGSTTTQTSATPSGSNGSSGVFTSQNNPVNTASTSNGGQQGSGFQFDVRLNNPLKVDNVEDAIKFFVNTLIKIAIPFIVIFFIWAGLKFILAQGKPEEVTKAKKMFWYTIIGTLLILGAWTITNAIIGTVNSITG